MSSDMIDVVRGHVSCVLCGDLGSLDGIETKRRLDYIFDDCRMSPEIVHDIKEDIKSLHEGNTDIEECVVHPTGEMNSGSIITLSNSLEEKRDPFLDVLLSTYKHTRRENTKVSRKKVTVVNASKLTETFEFVDDKLYWQFICAIKKSHQNKAVTLRGKCILTNSEIVKASQESSMLFKVENEVSFLISNLQLDVTLCKGSTSDTHRIELPSLLALALHADYDPYLSMQFQVSSFSCRWVDSAGGAVDDLHINATYEHEGFGRVTSGDVPVADGEFISLLVPNDVSSMLSLYVKHDIHSDMSSVTSGVDGSAILGKLKMPINAFFPSTGLTPPRQNTRRRPSLTERNSLPRSLDIEIPLSPPDVDLVAKLAIVSASNLPCAKSVIPNAYCVVYIVGRDGRVIESVGNKTIPIKSTDPKWDVEFMLHTTLGVAEIDSVLIKVKDAGVGRLRHKHLGQVEVPAAVFVPTSHPARLRLPITPTERMQSSTDDMKECSLGEITIRTQLIKTPKLAPPPVTGLLSSLSVSSSPDGDSNEPRTPVYNRHRKKLSLRSMPGTGLTDEAVPREEESSSSPSAPQGGLATLRCTLTHISPSRTWWPCFGLTSNNSDGRQGAGVVLDNMECLLDYDEWIIRTRLVVYPEGSSQHGGRKVMVQSSRTSATRTSQSGEVSSKDDYVRLPWTQVVDIMQVTDSAVLVSFVSPFQRPSVMVPRRRSSLFSRTPASSTYEMDTQEEVILEMLIGPCPAEVVMCLLRDRISTSVVREDIRRHLQISKTITPTTQSLSRPVVTFIRDSLKCLSCCIDLISGDTIDTVQSGVEIMGNVSPRTARMRMYIFLLIRMCRKIKAHNFPTLDYYELDAAISEEFTRGENVSMTFNDRQRQWLTVIESWRQLLSRDENSDSDDEVEALSTRGIIEVIDSIMSSCVHLVNLVVLCGAGELGASSLPFSGQAVITRAVSRVVNEHFVVMKHVVKFFVSSESAFQLIPGQTNKTNFLKYLVIYDTQLSDILAPSLSLLGLECIPLPELLGTDGLKEAVRLYSRGLVVETRMWLARTIKHSKLNKQNSYGLPWDIERCGELMISALPEVLRFQMNSYTDLIQESHKPGSSPDGHRSHVADVRLSSVHMASMRLQSQHSISTRSMSRDESPYDVSGTEQTLWQTIGLHEQILRAICKSLLLLAHEYTMALQSKHWDKPQSFQQTGSVTSPRAGDVSRDAESESLMFLISVANDAYRVRAVHLSELLRIESNVDWSDGTKCLIQSVTDEFQSVSEKAVKSIVRIIFSDLETVLANFDGLWHAHEKYQRGTDSMAPPSPVLAIIYTMQDFLFEIAQQIESQLFFDVVVACADVCALRYMLFLRNLSANLTVLSNNDISRIQLDVTALVDSFKKHSEFELNHHLNPVSRALSSLTDAVLIITESSHTDPNFLFILQRIAHQKRNMNKEDKQLMHDALTAMLRLRRDCGPDSGANSAYVISNMVNNALAPLPAHSPLLRSAIDSDTIVLRAFRDNTETRSQSGAENKIMKGFRQFTGLNGGLSSTPSKKRCDKDATDMRRNLGLLDMVRSRSSEIPDSDYAAQGTGVKLLDDQWSEATKMTVVIKCIQCKNLVTKSAVSLANPYVVVTYEDQRHKTKVKWNSSNPVWNDVLRIENVPKVVTNKKIDVKVYDKERIARKTLIGAVVIAIDGIDLNPIESWFALSEGVISSNGEIYLNIVGEPNN